MKVLEHVSFNVEDEESEDIIAGVGKIMAGLMRININDGVPSQNPLRSKRFVQGRQAHQQTPHQAGPSNPEDFDHEIPQTPPTQDLK